MEESRGNGEAKHRSRRSASWERKEKTRERGKERWTEGMTIGGERIMMMRIGEIFGWLSGRCL